MTEVEKCIKMIRENNYPPGNENATPNLKKAIVKAFQIGKHALIEWGIIIEDYEKYEVNYNINHNIMVKNQKEIVDTVDKFIQEAVKTNPEFAQFAFNKKEEIFPLMLLMCSKTCCKSGLTKFHEIMNNGNAIEKIKQMRSINGIDELYSTDGISKETEDKFNEFLDEIMP